MQNNICRSQSIKCFSDRLLAAFLIYFAGVTDHRYIRLDNGIDLVIGKDYCRFVSFLGNWNRIGDRQADIIRGVPYLAGVISQEGPYYPMKGATDPLMLITWRRRHFEYLSLYEFYPLFELPGKVVGIGVFFVEVELVNVCDYRARTLSH